MLTGVSALSLLLVAVVSIVVGMVSIALYLNSQVDISFRIPGIAYWPTVLGGLAASLAIIASTFPLLSSMTGPRSPETREGACVRLPNSRQTTAFRRCRSLMPGNQDGQFQRRSPRFRKHPPPLRSGEQARP